MATTLYPDAIDTDLNLPPATGDDQVSVNAVISATEAIETELGITPSGVYADVRTRLDILEARINNPLAPAPNVLNPFFISGTGVTIQTGVGDPNVTLALHPAKPSSLYLRQDGYGDEVLYVSTSDGYWGVVEVNSNSDKSLQSTWYIDPAGGSDSNGGLTSGTAIKTYAEFIRRVGPDALFANMSSGLSIHWLNDQPNNSDPVDIFLRFHNASFFMDGALIEVGSGTFGAVTNLNRASNILTTAFNSNGGAPSNYWTQYLGYLVHDTTNDTWFRVDEDLGSRQARFTRPYTGAANFIAFTNTPGSISLGDSYIVYRFPKIYLGSVALEIYGEELIPSSPLGTLTQLTHLHMVTGGTTDPMGARVSISGGAYFVTQECLWDGLTDLDGDVYEQSFSYNDYFSDIVIAREWYFVGGSCQGLDAGFETNIDGDFMVHPGANANGGIQIQGNIAIGTAYVTDNNNFFDIPLYLPSAPNGGSLTFTAGIYESAQLYGPAKLRVRSNGKVILGSGSAVGCLLNTGGFQLDGLTTGAKIIPGTPRITNDGVSVTPSNIDDTTGGKAAGMISSTGSGSGFFPFA